MRYEIDAVPKALELARLFSAVGLSNGNMQAAIVRAQEWVDTPRVHLTMKAAVDAGTTTADGWASDLAPYRMSETFLDFERGFSIIGKLRAFMRPALFLTTLVKETVAESVEWVAEGETKPLTASAFDTLAIPAYKMCGHQVITKELLRFSKPAAAQIVAQSLPRAIARYMDNQFLLKAVALSAGEHPASITNGAGNVNTTGPSAAQITADLNDMTDAIGSDESLFWIMKPKTFGTICAVVPTLVHIEGGNAWLMGIPVIRSTNSPAQITLVDAADILLADDGEVSIGLSQQATITLDDGVSPASTTMMSLWQNNLVALRAERAISWLRGHDNAVVSMTVAY